LHDYEAISGHPKVGASWEGFALEQVLRLSASREAYFWATQSGAELDLLLFENGQRIGYEFKFSEQPRLTRSMRVALEDLRLTKLRVICPGEVVARLDERVEVIGLNQLSKFT
jgi:hypothetical protein